MPHVTFIHGIANKPEPAVLTRIWRDTLARDDGVDLGAEGVTSSMVYWADVLYAAPQDEIAAHENNESIIARGKEEIDMSWRDVLDGAERSWTESLVSKIGFDASAPENDEEFVASESEFESMAAAEFERVPLPWWLKRRLMKVLLRDVHHYLFNAEHEPRPGERYRVQDEIRKRMLAALEEGAARPGPHIIVSHSMGTVISYDCLKRVPACPPVDGLMTIGSPLGLDEVQDKMAPEWSRDDGYPGERVKGAWVNVFDRLDLVAAFDPEIADDYQRSGTAVVSDVNEPNWGTWRHNITHYLSGSQLRSELAKMLRL